jgi:hypothetical protein
VVARAGRGRSGAVALQSGFWAAPRSGLERAVYVPLIMAGE